MNDDMNEDMKDDTGLPEVDPELALASAYLDDDVDADERARLEASPSLLALVATLRRLRISLADVPAPLPASQDVAVAAALAEFDAIVARPAAAAAIAGNVVAMPRARWSRVLTAAAAALIIGVVGVAVLNATGGGSSNSTSSKGGTGPGVVPAAGGTATDSAEGVTASTIGSIDGGADALPRYDQPDELRTLPDALSPSPGDVTGVESTSRDFHTTQDSSNGATQGTGVPTAANTPGQPLIGQLVFPFHCPLTGGQVFIAEISWRGTPAAAVRDTVTGVTQAIDLQCNVLVSVPPQP